MINWSMPQHFLQATLAHRKRDAGQLPVVDNRTKAKLPGSGNFGYSDHVGELPWVGRRDFPWNAANPYGIDGQHQPECARESLWSPAALWRYVQSDKIYCCPMGEKGELMTYTISDSMNSVKHAESQVQVQKQKRCSKSWAQIKRPGGPVCFYR